MNKKLSAMLGVLCGAAILSGFAYNRFYANSSESNAGILGSTMDKYAVTEFKTEYDKGNAYLIPTSLGTTIEPGSHVISVSADNKFLYTAEGTAVMFKNVFDTGYDYLIISDGNLASEEPNLPYATIPAIKELNNETLSLAFNSQGLDSVDFISDCYLRSNRMEVEEARFTLKQDYGVCEFDSLTNLGILATPDTVDLTFVLGEHQETILLNSATIMDKDAFVKEFSIGKNSTTNKITSFIDNNAVYIAAGLGVLIIGGLFAFKAIKKRK